VRFSYPDDQIAQEKAAQEQRVAQAQARMVDSAFAKANLPINWNYYACGEREIRPFEVYDDGRFTFMRFPGAQEIPAIFMINTDGSESIVNGAMQGDRYVVQLVARQLVLRKGQSVACLENRSFNRYGITTPSGTASPDVERVLAPAAKRDNRGAVSAPARAPAPVAVPDATARPIQLKGVRPDSPAMAPQGGSHVSQ
jgi:type IV secretion system protein VirB9